MSSDQRISSEFRDKGKYLGKIKPKGRLCNELETNQSTIVGKLASGEKKKVRQKQKGVNQSRNEPSKLT